MTDTNTTATENTEATNSEATEEELTVGQKMAKTLAKHKVNYTKATNSEGTKTMHNGDDLAVWMNTLTAEEVAQVADKLTGKETGWHQERYQHLNRGQLRMNSGNKIRAIWKKGEEAEFFQRNIEDALEREAEEGETEE